MPAAAEQKTQRSTEKKGEVAKVGNLTKSFELRYVATGRAVASSVLAVDRPKVTGDWAGERETQFYDLTVFGDMAENVAACLTKGMRVVVIGNAELQHWADHEGQERVSRAIVVTAIGPDLRWATAQVNKVRRRVPAERPGTNGAATNAPAPPDGIADEDF